MIAIQQSEVMTPEGYSVKLEYDPDADMLEIFFKRGRASGALEIADPIILRFDRESGEALSLSILTFSKLIKPSEFGPLAFPLSGLESLPRSLKSTIISLLQNPPVNYFLRVVSYIPTTHQSPIPLSYMRKNHLLNKLPALAA